MNRCYISGQFTDLVINCAGYQFECHKLIVCTQSTFFNAACVNSFQEGLTSVINLPCDDPYLIRVLLSFFYTGSLYLRAHAEDIELNDPKHPNYRYRTVVLLYALADKYGISSLTHACSQSLRWAYTNYNAVIGLLHCVPSTYTTTPDTNRGLRDITTNSIVKYAEKISEDAETLRLLMEHIDNFPQFRNDLVLAFIAGHTYACPLIVPQSPQIDR
ncbi:MAG: hypothetical protein Q9202_004528 [Teloschistes flavicans]